MYIYTYMYNIYYVSFNVSCLISWPSLITSSNSTCIITYLKTVQVQELVRECRTKI